MQARHLTLFVSALALTAAAQAFAQGQDVRGQNGNPEPLVPIYMEYDSIKGESRDPPPPPPPPPPPQPSQQAGLGVNSGQHEQAGLLVPAVQRVRDSAATAQCAEGHTYYVGSANGGVWKTTNGGSASPSDVAAPPVEGELQYNFAGIEGAAAEEAPPSCQDVDSGRQEQAGMLLPAVQKAQDPPAEAEAERPQRRGGFSVSFGGITVGSGGVSVAAGDVNGDGRGDSRSPPERRSDRRR